MRVVLNVNCKFRSVRILLELFKPHKDQNKNKKYSRMFLWPYNFRRSYSGSPLHKTPQDTLPSFPYHFTTSYKVIISDRLQCNCKTVCTRRPDVTRARFVMTPNHSIKVVGVRVGCQSLHAYIDNDAIWTAPRCRYELSIHILLSPTHGQPLSAH
jgi:hypothetical protein